MHPITGPTRRDVGRGLVCGLSAGVLSWATGALAQDSPKPRREPGASPDAPDPSRGEPAAGGLLEYTRLRSFRWRVTLTLEALEDAVRDVTAYFAVPIEWPEQAVEFVEEVKPANVRTRPREVAGLGALMIANVSAIAAGKTVQVVRGYDVTRYAVRFKPGNDPETFRIPSPLPAGLKSHVGVSPGIETTLPKIVELGKTLRDPDGRAWVTARTCYDWVRRNVKFELGDYPRRAAGAGGRDRRLRRHDRAVHRAMPHERAFLPAASGSRGTRTPSFISKTPSLKAGC